MVAFRSSEDPWKRIRDDYHLVERQRRLSNCIGRKSWVEDNHLVQFAEPVVAVGTVGNETYRQRSSPEVHTTVPRTYVIDVNPCTVVVGSY